MSIAANDTGQPERRPPSTDAAARTGAAPSGDRSGPDSSKAGVALDSVAAGRTDLRHESALARLSPFGGRRCPRPCRICPVESFTSPDIVCIVCGIHLLTSVGSRGVDGLRHTGEMKSNGEGRAGSRTYELKWHVIRALRLPNNADRPTLPCPSKDGSGSIQGYG